MPVQLQPSSSFELLEQVVDMVIKQDGSLVERVSKDLLKAHVVARTHEKPLWPNEEAKTRLVEKLLKFSLARAETSDKRDKLSLRSWLTEFLVTQLGVDEVMYLLHSHGSEAGWTIQQCSCVRYYCPGWNIATQEWFDNAGPEADPE